LALYADGFFSPASLEPYLRHQTFFVALSLNHVYTILPKYPMAASNARLGELSFARKQPVIHPPPPVKLLWCESQASEYFVAEKDGRRTREAISMPH
jgi:hypothetical protein